MSVIAFVLGALMQEHTGCGRRMHERLGARMQERAGGGRRMRERNYLWPGCFHARA